MGVGTLVDQSSTDGEVVGSIPARDCPKLVCNNGMSDYSIKRMKIQHLKLIF